MDSVIYNPLEAYETSLKDKHKRECTAFFEGLVAQSKVNIEENRQTVAQHEIYKENLAKLKKKLTLWLVLRVLMCITLVLIPVVILKTNPKIKGLREEIEQASDRADALLAQAYDQMLPLNSLFTDRDALELICRTMPLLSFDSCFTLEKEADMKINYDFCPEAESEASTLEVLSGAYNGNPFLFENKLVHTMGTETYRGSITISWTETYRDSSGNLRSRTKTETLHASVEKPKPYYNTHVVLNYGAQGAPDLAFSRDATHLEQKSEKAIERYVKKGEKKIKKMSEKALRENGDFTSMSNSDFEVLFDALNRTDEVQFRTLFTPLAQTNMVDLLLSKVGYGDDFHFHKTKRMNQIFTEHSQGRKIQLLPSDYTSYAFDRIQENFIQKNIEFFRAVYFDFAPLLAIPAYQERPIHSLKPIPDYEQTYALKECEVLANAVSPQHMVHPDTKTQAILKADFVRAQAEVDEHCIRAYSYDILERIDYVPVFGGDGKYHDVPVHWDEYLPLESENTFFVSRSDMQQGSAALATRDGLCIFKG